MNPKVPFSIRSDVSDFIDQREIGSQHLLGNVLITIQLNQFQHFKTMDLPTMFAKLLV